VLADGVATDAAEDQRAAVSCVGAGGGVSDALYHERACEACGGMFTSTDAADTFCASCYCPACGAPPGVVCECEAEREADHARDAWEEHDHRGLNGLARESNRSLHESGWRRP
jgi:hypothetical protein